MLTASRRQFECPTNNMGVSQEQQSFEPPENATGVYFVFPSQRDSLRYTANSCSDTSDSEAMSERSENSSPTESLTLQEQSEPVISEERSDLGKAPVPYSAPSPKLCPSAKPKHGTTIVGLPDSLVAQVEATGKKDKPKKKKKWRAVGAEDMGFRLSLFPREPVTDGGQKDVEKEEAMFLAFEAELEIIDNRMKPYQHLLQLEGAGLGKDDKLSRKDRNHRVQKAHKQVKTKNVTSVLNNPGRKTLYIHFRIYKLNPFLHCSNLEHPNLPSAPKRPGVCLDVARSAVKAQQRAVAASLSSSSPRARRAPPAQNLAHALDNNNAASELPTDIISFLISIQHREMTPEDYEMLLRLDDSVAPKTVQEDVITSFKTDIVDDTSVGGVCSVCMEAYGIGQKRKFLPCEHVFHEECIDMWLSNSSQNCPLDGLPVGVS